MKLLMHNIQIKLQMQSREDIHQRLNLLYSKISLECKGYLQNDPLVEREDTCKGLITLLQQIKNVLKEVNSFSVQERAKNYYITYNAVNYILEISEHLRRTNFAFETSLILAEAIKSMEGNIILQDVKYLDKITELYLKLAKIYEDGQNYQEAVSILENALKQYKELKAIHELDQPVPAYVQAILVNNLKLIKVFFIKYTIQAGGLSPAEWRKKVDQEFGDDTQIKLFCLIESLRTQTRKNSNIFIKNMKSFKESLLLNGFEMIKPQLEILSKGLTQQKEKIERQVNFRSTLNTTQQQINEQIKKRRQLQEKYIKQSEIRKASEAFPLEYHAELIHYALQIKNHKVLTELIQSAQIRIECRRIEVPYVNDIMIVVSNSPYPNIPNGYTKIPIDLNEANMKKELIKLRKSGKKPPEDQTLKAPIQAPPAVGKDEKKDNKKGGKEPEKPAQSNQSKQNDLNREPTQWQLNEIKHKYVFMMIKKSMSPENALYDMGVVLGNEEKGPVGFADNRRIIVPYIQENMKIIQSQINQHTGVRQTTGLVPYIILYHSRNNLQDQNQKKTIITDVVPLIGKNPIVPAKWGYKKIDLDLRQVPAQFIKAPNHDYVYLTYKTDELFHISERHVQIIKAFIDLESTYGQRKGNSTQEEKFIQLELNYDIQKLGLFFQTLQESLRGELGQQYYLQKSDFLTNLTLEIWSKYLKNPLIQFDYMKQQRLNGEIIDYDYQNYKKILEDCNSIFLKGLKVLNLIMVNNPKSDILLQSKINLQLAKLLQQTKMYKMAAENIKLCLDKLRKFRDQYLSKGVDGSSDKILPFAITCSNMKIKKSVQAMRKKNYEQRRQLEKVIRIKQRQNQNDKILSTEQLEEQEKQFIRYRKNDQFDELIEKIGTKHSQIYSIIYALELDLLNLYFRVSLKRADEVCKLESSKNDLTNGIRNTQLEGLATTLKQKLGLINGPTQTKNVQNLNQLQNTLVKASKLPAPKPKIAKPQLKLIIQYQKNPYALALLMLNFAALNSENNDKKYYLQQSLSYIENCLELQNQMMDASIQNAIFIFSGLWDSKIHEEQNSQKIYPFKDLYSDVWQKETDVPEPPILIGKNSTSIHLKLPPFVPNRVSQKRQPKTIKYMSIYGKPSANGVDVSINCVELQGTGIRKQIGKSVKISSLTPNNLYCFAAAGIDQNEQIMRIGKTGEDIGTFNPLSIPMLASYLAKVAYQINEYQIAQKASQIIINEYCNQVKYLTYDERVNNLYYYTLNEETISGISLFEMKTVAQAFYISALCLRRKANELKETSAGNPPIIYQEKQKLITNLLMLSAALTPTMASPNISIPFLIPENEALLRAITINMIPEKWMNPKIRKVGVGVMEKLLKWGLENNEINLARRLVYKWNERKYLLMGKMIQIEEKKQVKKGAKDSKEQEVKLIDKYCRLMIEKSPQLMDAFEDSMVTISEEYYDYVALFVQKAKDQVNTISQYVDNPPQQIDSINNHFALKLQLIEYLKDPIQSIKKITNTSPYYFQYNSKILKKALQVASEAEYKQLLAKSEDLDLPEVTQEIKISKEIYDLMFSAIKEDIAWSPESKMQLITFQQKTGKDLKKAIEIFTTWQSKKTDLTSKIRKGLTLSNKYKDYDYLNMWISEIYHLKAQAYVLMNCNEFNVKRKIKVRYDKIQGLNIEDLFKKQTQISVLEDRPYAYSQDQLKKFIQILTYISQAAYSAMVIQNWLKLESLLKFLCNVICYIQATPFYHKGSSVWTYFTFISLCSIEMLRRIKRYGFYEFKQRYNNKLNNTEKANIIDKLQMGEFKADQLIEQFVPEYYLPDLDSNTTKSFWFMKEKDLDIEAISSIIAYTVNTLRLQNKHNLVINIVRQFCNVTQHYFSLALLPFMTNSQSKLIQEVEKMIAKQMSERQQVQRIYNIQKEKKGKKRAAALTGQKYDFEIVYEQKSARLKESLRLLTEQKKFLESQTNKSNRIKDEISRDTSKQVLAQKDQKKYTEQFGEHYQQMLRQFGQEAKHVKKSKNFIKDIINKYDAIYEQLKNSKTSKDTFAQIQNRNDVGNLWFASGNLQKAYEFWNDSLATIFRQVNPIEHYHEILQKNKPYLVETIGNREIIIALCIIYKLSNFGGTNKLNIQRSCADFACHLAFSLFQTNLVYPQTYEMYKDFRIKKFQARQIFADQNSINLTELLSSLEYFTLRNIYEENGLSALPMVTFFQYLATDVVKNTELSIKAKILKSICLSEAGYISQSIKYLIKVASQKDLPIIWLQSSDFLKKQKGMNWVQDGPLYNNNEFWTNAENKLVIQQFKKITIRQQSTALFGIINPVLFNYAKSFTLFKIYQNEICKDDALNDQRLQNLNEVDVLMRQSLKKLSIVEEAYSLLEEYENNSILFKQNEVSDDLKKQMEASRLKLVDYLKKNGHDQNTIKLYEKQQYSSLKRIFRLEFMCKIRYSLHKISESRNMLTNSYFILKNGMTNVHRYTIGARICQTGYDPEIKVVNIAQPPPGKKDDKKGGKKQQQAQQPVVAPPVDQKKEKQLREKNEAKSSRTSLNAYWHIKILFQLAKITFKQNNFKESMKFFSSISEFCKKYEQQYYLLHCKAFICRTKLRLGHFQPEQFKQVISKLEDSHFLDLNFLNFVMDYGEILSGQTISLEYFQKGKEIAQAIWQKYGMKSILSGIGLVSQSKNFYQRQQTSAEQDQMIKKKKKGQKKGGKDDKKPPPKKEDPKKKKQDNKIEFKITPLSKITEINLLEEEKNIFGQYALAPHPNYRKNNIYQPYPLLYIKSYLRHLSQLIQLNPSEDFEQQIPVIIKLLHVLETYAHSIQHLKIFMYACVAKINKNTFIMKLKDLIKNISNNYLHLIKHPFEDFPLNSSLINLPSYSNFIAENRKYLLQAKSYYKKCLTLVQNSTFFYEKSINIEDYAWQYADNQCLLAEYTGREKPKYYPEDQIQINSEQRRLQIMNNIFEATSFLEFAIKIRSIKFDIARNYLQIGGKGLDPNAKIDEDITSQILEMDKQYKKTYPQFLIDSYKGKGALTGTDVITYMLKIYREAQFMTFTNPSYQNLLFKCNRILTKFLAGYKDKCIISNMDVPLKKSIKDKFVDNQSILIKSIRNQDSQIFLYVVGPQTDGDEPYYGRIVIELSTLSTITEDILSLTTKTAISDKKSEAVKNRDYIIYRNQFKRILHQISTCLGNPKIDDHIKPIPQEFLVELNAQNLKTAYKLFDSNGLSIKNKDFNRYFRFLHRIKYQL